MIALNRARTTFQRIADAKFFNGWVKRITPDAIIVLASLSNPLDAGQDFSFQVYGNKKNAHLRARLVSIRPVASALAIVDGPNPHAGLFELECHVVSKIQFTDATEQPRFNVEAVFADITRTDGFCNAEAEVVDVGPGGLAALTDSSFARGDQVTVALCGHGESLEFEAEVRNCSLIGKDSGRQRTGMQIKQIDRLNAARWKHFYAEVVERNRAHWVPEAADLAAPIKPKF